jgi:hypothetical protein
MVGNIEEIGAELHPNSFVHWDTESSAQGDIPPNAIPARPLC